MTEEQIAEGEINAEFPILEPFYVTFGVQHPREPHPTFEGADGSGYFVIHAPDEVTARTLAHGMFAGKWAFLYTREEFQPDSERTKGFYPLGRIGYAATTARLKAA